MATQPPTTVTPRRGTLPARPIRVASNRTQVPSLAVVKDSIHASAACVGILRRFSGLMKRHNKCLVIGILSIRLPTLRSHGMNNDHTMLYLDIVFWSLFLLIMVLA